MIAVGKVNIGKRRTRNEDSVLVSNEPIGVLPNLYIVTDGILLAPREKMIEWSYFHGRNPYRFILDKRTAVDIDDGLDLACARAWLDMDESVSQIDPYCIDAIK